MTNKEGFKWPGEAEDAEREAEREARKEHKHGIKRVEEDLEELAYARAFMQE